MARYRSNLYSRGTFGRAKAWGYAVSAFVVLVLVCYGLYRLVRWPSRPPSAAVSAAVESTGGDVAGSAAPAAAEPAASSPEPSPASQPEPAAVPASEPELELMPARGAPDPPKLVSQALAMLDESPPKVIEARDMLNEALAVLDDREQLKSVKLTLSRLADDWLFSRTVYPGDALCESYLVKPGDVLAAIGEDFKVPYQILMEINGITRAESLRASDTIKVINGPFHAVIYRSEFTMGLYLQHTFVKSFPVGLGRPGMDTPTGLWLVKRGGKLIAPAWTDPDTGKTYQAEDPDYPLGSRWIGLEGIEGNARDRTGFAIHGTKEPAQIGSAGSRGCIRLHNGDAILVYNLLKPGYSQVRVVE